MPIPEDLIKVQMNFALGGQDLAVSGFHMRLNHITGAATNWPEMCQTAARKVYDKWKSNNGSGRFNMYPTAVSLRDVAVYHLEAATGHALDKGLAGPDASGPWSGSASQALPYETSCAVTLFGYDRALYTPDKARRRGRTFLPPFGTVMMGGVGANNDHSESGRYAGNNLGSVRSGVLDFFNDVHQMSVGPDPLDIGQTWDLVVLSKTAGQAYRVRSIGIGNVPDSQRRRRNGQSEVYSYGTITDERTGPTG